MAQQIEMRSGNGESYGACVCLSITALISPDSGRLTLAARFPNISALLSPAPNP